MPTEIKAPSPGESISEVQVAVWLKQDGDVVQKDDVLCEIESDKATLTVSASAAGQLKILVPVGDVVAVGTVLATIDAAGKGATPKPVAATAERPTLATSHQPPVTGPQPPVTPSQPPAPSSAADRPVRRERMSMLRKSLAERLVAVKNTTAMLTTFNEVDMSAVQALRARHKESFQTKYGVKLGLMSFFVRAVVGALREFPAVNAAIEGDEIVFHDYMDIGIAVSAPKGLMVPIIRHAEALHAGQIEQSIAALAEKARSGKLTLDDMTNGTFTLTNGGVFGSMLSTPILNPPQSGILGMHNIADRPVVVQGQVAIRPIMYVAFSYDHRIIDGRESVGFLKLVKEQLEKPEPLLGGI
ncbi:MAG: dihydrolipoyllysine-residue succinyltransferase [Deltaproteobacteria bacterium]|nr:dihydrolipoyllysine-residue succinyltransferase [Deltaproteobacteria bacterium]